MVRHATYGRRNSNPSTPKRKVDMDISIDIREPQWIIDQFKQSCNTDRIRIEAFEVGDYFVGDTIGIERKAVHDFVLSIPKVFSQVQELKDNFNIPYLLLEGDFSLLFGTRSQISPNAILGALISVKAHYDVNIMFTNQAMVVQTILALFEKHTDGKAIPYRPIRPKPSITDHQLHILTSLPSVGEKTARELLERFNTPVNAIRNIDDWTKVRGITPQRARKIKEILYQGEPDDTWEV